MKVVIEEGVVWAITHDHGEEFAQALRNEGLDVDLACRRASWVEPESTVLRMAFHVIRRLGDSGWLADWTRRWRCYWRVDLRPSGGPVVSGLWRSREEAIAAEVKWLGDKLENIVAK